MSPILVSDSKRVSDTGQTAPDFSSAWYYQATAWQEPEMNRLGRFGTLLCGAGLMLLAATALAQSGGGGSDHVVGWTFWLNLAFGILLTVVGAYVKGQNGRLEKLENNYAELHRLVLRDYHSKHDLADILGEIKSSVKALHQRFDDILSNNGQGKRHGN